MSFYSINAHASILNEERPDPVGSEGGAFEGGKLACGQVDTGRSGCPRDMMGSDYHLVA